VRLVVDLLEELEERFAVAQLFGRLDVVIFKKLMLDWGRLQ
jgi:hypothetical protein